MRSSFLLIAGTICLVTAASAGAQGSYPNRPIRLVVSSAAGGTGDTMARAVSRLVEKELNGSIVVDNRPGATGIIATDTVAKAEPNGYTLLHTSSAFVTNAATGRKLPYDITKDFIPVSSLAMAEGYLVLVNASLPVTSIKELIALAKTKNLLYGSPGTGNPIHFTTAALCERAGITMTHVPYKALAPALTAVISGEIQVLLAPPIATKPHIASGKLRALASVSAKRVSSMPDLPTMQELGFQGFTLEGGWQGWVAPARTPANVLSRLHGAIVSALQSEELRAFMHQGGYVPDGKGPAEFRAEVMSDLKRFRDLAQVAHIKVE